MVRPRYWSWSICHSDRDVKRGWFMAETERLSFTIESQRQVTRLPPVFDILLPLA